MNRWTRRASTATPSWSKRSASGGVEQPSRFDPCRILARKGIPSAVWFEDALFLYGSDTAVFDLYILVPDVGAASAVLQDAGYRQADFDGLLPEGVQLTALLQRGKIDKHDLFSQLVAVGADLVGAVTIEVLADKPSKPDGR